MSSLVFMRCFHNDYSKVVPISGIFGCNFGIMKHFVSFIEFSAMHWESKANVRARMNDNAPSHQYLIKFGKNSYNMSKYHLHHHQSQRILKKKIRRHHESNSLSSAWLIPAQSCNPSSTHMQKKSIAVETNGRRGQMNWNKNLPKNATFFLITEPNQPNRVTIQEGGYVPSPLPAHYRHLSLGWPCFSVVGGGLLGAVYDGHTPHQCNTHTGHPSIY